MCLSVMIVPTLTFGSMSRSFERALCGLTHGRERSRLLQRHAIGIGRTGAVSVDQVLVRADGLCLCRCAQPGIRSLARMPMG